MKKIKSLLITLMFFLSLAVYGKSISAGNYRINNGKIELLNYDRGLSDNISVKRANGAEVITGSEDLRITDEGGRVLVTKISGGLIDGKYDEYYANGNTFLTGRYENGKKEGEWRTYTEEGYLWKKHTYKNGQLNGKFVNYYTKTGVEETVGNYVNGKKEGNWISYYSSGRKKLSGDYMEGHRQGAFTEWYENGQKKSVINYSYDIVDGKMTVYYDTGAIFYEGNMNDKDGTVKGYDQNGTLRFEGKLEKGKKVGNWTYYDGMGNPIR